MAADPEGRYYPDLMAAPGDVELRGLLWEWRTTLKLPHPGGCGSRREGSLIDCDCLPPFPNLRARAESEDRERVRHAAHMRATEALREAYGHD